MPFILIGKIQNLLSVGDLPLKQRNTPKQQTLCSHDDVFEKAGWGSHRAIGIQGNDAKSVNNFTSPVFKVAVVGLLRCGYSEVSSSK